jgi:hypothetical protein
MRVQFNSNVFFLLKLTPPVRPAKYPAAVIVDSGVLGVEESFATADRGLPIMTEGHSADFDRLARGAGELGIRYGG